MLSLIEDELLVYTAEQNIEMHVVPRTLIIRSFKRLSNGQLTTVSGSNANVHAFIVCEAFSFKQSFNNVQHSHLHDIFPFLSVSHAGKNLSPFLPAYYVTPITISKSLSGPFYLFNLHHCQVQSQHHANTHSLLEGSSLL